MRQDHEAAGTLAAKATPALGYLGATFAGMSLPDWASLLAIIYTTGLLVQMGYRCAQWVAARRKEKGITGPEQ